MNLVRYSAIRRIDTPKLAILRAIAWLVVFPVCALAQHEHHAPPPTPTPIQTRAPSAHEHHAPPEPTPSQPRHEHGSPAAATPGPSQTQPAAAHDHHAMVVASNRNLFQSDMTLMTGMTPRDPMEGMSTPDWHVMVLGIARLGYNRQSGPSGDDAFESSNWNMIHAGRRIGSGRLSLMLMNSLEPWTFERRGSLELFQTGETYRGRPLVDHQHPHDFFMNVSATYRLPIGKEAAAWFQLAPVGEPTIGPTAFMHRASAGENPTAPLGHHWQDSAHITFNVATAGVGWKAVSLEGSVFHGAEPDEDRWDIEGGKIDSAAGRLRVTIRGGWSAQLSYAFLHDPEAELPGDLHRTTASIHYGAEGDRPFAATLLWGRNDETHGVSESVLLEAAYQVTAVDQVYGRIERVEKDRHLLLFKGAEVVPAIEVPDIARIGALTLGYVKEVGAVRDIRIGAGADLTGYTIPSGLEAVYGKGPLSAHVFLRLRWGNPHGGTSHH